MTKRSFPDVNVWFALAVADHPHHRPALAWWNEESSLAGFSRLTQIGLLRLLTTSAAMGGLPLTNEEARDVYDGFLADDRVRMFPELATLDDLFRSFSSLRQASPKVWVDAYLAAHASANNAVLVNSTGRWLAMEPNAGSWARLSCDPCLSRRPFPQHFCLPAGGWTSKRLNVRQYSSVSRIWRSCIPPISRDTDSLAHGGLGCRCRAQYRPRPPRWRRNPEIYLLKPTCARNQGTSLSKVNRFPS